MAKFGMSTQEESNPWFGNYGVTPEGMGLLKNNNYIGQTPAFAAGGALYDPSAVGTYGQGGGFGGFMRGLGEKFGGTSSFSEATGGPNAWQAAFGGKDLDTKSYTKGWTSGAANLGSKLFGGYMAFRNMKMLEGAYDQEKFNQNRNYAAQKHSFNEEAASINAAREARAPGAGHRIREL